MSGRGKVMDGRLVEVTLSVPNATDPFTEFCSSTSEEFGFSGCLRCFEPLRTKENKGKQRNVLIITTDFTFEPAAYFQGFNLPMSDSLLTL